LGTSLTRKNVGLDTNLEKAPRPSEKVKVLHYIL